MHGRTVSQYATSEPASARNTACRLVTVFSTVVICACSAGTATALTSPRRKNCTAFQNGTSVANTSSSACSGTSSTPRSVAPTPPFHTRSRRAANPASASASAPPRYTTSSKIAANST